MSRVTMLGAYLFFLPACFILGAALVVLNYVDKLPHRSKK